MNVGDAPVIRRGLAARLDDCWDRLDDVVVELVALHEVDAEEICQRVRAAATAEGE